MALTGWQWRETATREFLEPGQISPDAGWRACDGLPTVAALLTRQGGFDAAEPTKLDRQDYWFRTRLEVARPGVIRCEMLAGDAEFWWQGVLAGRHHSMFVPLELPLPAPGDGWLYLCLRGTAEPPAKSLPRARWRTRMIEPKEMRGRRQTLLGHMPGWCPGIAVLGPVTPIHFDAETAAPWRITQLSADYQRGTARLRLKLAPHPAPPDRVQCAGTTLAFTGDAAGGVIAEGEIPAAGGWMPHTHGAPRLYPLVLHGEGRESTIGPIGFRRVTADLGADGAGFGIVINGEPVFARGVCWTPLDLTTLSGTAADYDHALTRIRDAGMNMVRVSGTMFYEHDDFFAGCDRLGILVWHDFMFANFDYPIADSGFRDDVTAEAWHFLARTRHHPALAVLCGGSEVRQQAEMSGVAWPAEERLFSGLLAGIAAAERPDVLYVPNSPWGGEPCFVADRGITHYYGVGAYLRPLEDARRAGVRFAAECLALAHLPAEADLPAERARQPLDAAWKRATPRDRGASWDFDDVRDHYVATLYGADPARLRYQDPARYLDLGRAVSCDLAEALFAEWRRPASGCAGGLVWQLRDLAAGAGWGLWNENGSAKPVWHALARTLRPVQLLLTDEGVNGLALHLINETGRAIDAHLTIEALRDGAAVVAAAGRDVTIAARSAETIASGGLLGRFFDSTYAYRFGPLSHDVTVARLHDRISGDLLSLACHLPVRCLPPIDPGFAVRLLLLDAGNWSLTISARRFAQYVHLVCDTHRVSDDWFHLPPGMEYKLKLTPEASPATIPCLKVVAINGAQPFSVRGQGL